jgi:predicted adenine nucleotide alpha hydrolase (AANH) superfamily ATPase
MIYKINMITNKPKILLHICCAACGAFVSRLLQENYDVTLYFYNPNIYLKEEYEKRMKEVEKIAAKFNLNLITGEYNHESWLAKISGYEKEPERGDRCRVCYRDRLSKTAELAEKNSFDYFTTTLTVSPHKSAEMIFAIGRELEKAGKVKFLEKDFKKQDGFRKSIALSDELELYRQNYCGCEFSLRKK